MADLVHPDRAQVELLPGEAWPTVDAKGMSTAAAITVDVHAARARMWRASQVAYGVAVAGETAAAR